MYNNINAILLSGGKSSRMGLNKSLIEINGEKLIESLFNKIKTMFNEVILVTNEPELYDFLDCRKVSDIFIGKGPLGGIHSGLLNSDKELNFVISCDLPLISQNAIEYIVENSNGNITLPLANGYVQELCGIYSKNLINAIEDKLNESNSEEIRHKDQKHRACKVHSFIKEQNANILEIENEKSVYNQNLFFNLNSQEDLEKLKLIIN